MSYEYDFFLSFPRDCTAGDWVVNHFFPLLTAAFQDECQSSPAVYCFTEKENAVYWPLELQNALRRSRFLIPILTPPYFYESKWCKAEYETMIERQKVVNWGTADNPSSLIFPVLYSGAKSLPASVKDIRGPYDLSKYAIPDAQYRDSASYIEFRARLREIARELDVLRNTAPPWDPDWPVVTPTSTPVVPPPNPTLPAL